MSSNVQASSDGTETAIQVEPAHFSTIDISRITKLVRTENQECLRDYGGVEGVVSTLKTNAEDGIHGDRRGIAYRRKVFGSNRFRKQSAKRFHYFMLEAFKDPVILILLMCSVFSVGFSIKRYGLKEGCYEGVTKLAALLLAVSVSAASNFWPHRKFHEISESNNNVQVDVVRQGIWRRIPISRIVVGDVVFLKPGDQVPADGLFLNGNSLLVHKLIGGQTDPVNVTRHQNPFLFTGTYVVDGNARMLVTAVGRNTRSEMMSTTRGDHPVWILLQTDQFKHLTSSIGEAGQKVAFLVLLVLLSRFFVGNLYGEKGNTVFIGGKTRIPDALDAIVGILVTTIMIASSATPDFLLLAVAITLAFSMKRMVDDQVLLRKLSFYQAAGSVTTICTNKTGTLTLQSMKVTKFWLGLSFIEESTSNLIPLNVLELLHQGIGLNTTKPPSNSLFKSPKNPTEKAIFNWAVDKMGMHIETLKESCTILQIEAFNSENKRSGVLISKKADDTLHVHHKGAPEVILAMCSRYYGTDGTIKIIDESARGWFEQIINGMAENGLRCIALAHTKLSIEDYFLETSRQELILLALLGLENPCRSRIIKAVQDCSCAGVNIKMITGDHVSTARAIAAKCGVFEIYGPGNVVEGEEFRRYTKEERMERIDQIRVMARASPSDKSLMVQCLKEKGHVVAVSGHGTGDALAIGEANIGLCLGLRGTAMAKENSDIVILKNSFASVIKVLRWGRGIYYNIQIIAQFKLTATIVSLVYDFVTAISAGEPSTIDPVSSLSAGKVPYPTLQLLWLQLTMGTLAALALIIKEPPKELMHKPPRGKTEPVITNIMWWSTMAQALYQIAIFLTIQFKGKSIFKVNDKVKDTLVFNTYVLCQVFAIFNARNREKNVFRMQQKKLFWGIIVMIIVLQVVMVEFLKSFADTARLDWGQWGTCIAIAAMTWPIDWLVKCISVLERPCFSYPKWLRLKFKVE